MKGDFYMRRLDAGNVVCVCGTLYRFTSEKELKVGSVILDMTTT